MQEKGFGFENAIRVRVQYTGYYIVDYLRGVYHPPRQTFGHRILPRPMAV